MKTLIKLFNSNIPDVLKGSLGPGGREGGGGVLRIASDRDDRRIFLGLKFFISGFFEVAENFGKYFFFLVA